jgi:hypothetical protein
MHSSTVWQRRHSQPDWMGAQCAKIGSYWHDLLSAGALQFELCLYIQLYLAEERTCENR